MSLRFFLTFAVPYLVSALFAYGFPEPTPDSPGKRMLEAYFERKVTEIERKGSLTSIQKAADWRSVQNEYRQQLAAMLGLDPMPEKSDLKPVVVGAVEEGDVVVERLHFQSMPGLYVTANFYRPKVAAEKPLPAILYVCGHATMKEGKISLGNKTGYHHHGLWFARNGYVCLTIDTLQLGEIEGEHHGTSRLGKWWWISRGYTPAGVEAWNGIRALDYMETRPEVDPKRFGITGRSGGGAYSWWIAALDDRIAVAAPTAGITSLRNHVVDGCIEGHCDCMFQVNTGRWDYDRIAALVAPRPLLISNTDKDNIFPLDGVYQVYRSTRRLYELLDAGDRIGLQIAEGPHKDVQPLNSGAFHWFDRFLKGTSPMDTHSTAATKDLKPSALRVFGTELPADQINTRIDHQFVATAVPKDPPADVNTWEQQSQGWKHRLQSEVFGAWPDQSTPPQLHQIASMKSDGVQMTAFDFESEDPFRLRLFLTHSAELALSDVKLVVLNVLDENGWQQFGNTYQSRFGDLLEEIHDTKPDETSFAQEAKMLSANPWVMAVICPRGIGPTSWQGSARAQLQRERRFYLIGETLASGQVWDIRRGLQAIRQVGELKSTRLWMQAHRAQAANSLLASLFETHIERLDLHEVPTTLHAGQPYYLNILKHLDLPHAAALATQHTKLIIYTNDEKPWAYPRAVGQVLGRTDNFQFRPPPEEP